jgi:uncharacterized protein DUF1579
MTRLSIVNALLSAAFVAALACPAGWASAAEKAPKKTTAKAEPKTEAAAAKDKTTTPPSQEEMMAAMMKLASPGPEHAALNPLAGSWKTTIKMWGDPAGPPTTEPTISQGTCDRNWVMGGRYLVGNYKGVFNKMPFEGMEVLGYDNMKKQYVSSWVDNMGTGIMLSTGSAMDPATKSFTLTGSSPGPTGENISMREVTNIVDGNTYTMTMYSAMGGQEQKMMEITYTRVK